MLWRNAGWFMDSDKVYLHVSLQHVFMSDVCVCLHMSDLIMSDLHSNLPLTIILTKEENRP